MNMLRPTNDFETVFVVRKKYPFLISVTMYQKVVSLLCVFLMFLSLEVALGNKIHFISTLEHLRPHLT